MQAFGEDVIGPNGQVIPITPAVQVGNLILLSGQLAMRKGKIIGETIEEQTHIALDNIEAILAPLGKSLADIAKVAVWLVNGADFAGFNAAYAERFTKPYPARSAVVSQLLIPGALVEIEALVTAE
ncbi:RidA family protein [Novosphingobium colocasiae]|uniref:RidA family protein n=1 Tax=Novosphingobium colocasiae TaxID=1256513 RepID=UPI0035B162D1